MQCRAEVFGSGFKDGEIPLVLCEWSLLLPCFWVNYTGADMPSERVEGRMPRSLLLSHNISREEDKFE